MKVNGIDVRKYNAKQLTVEIQPPSISNNYEWITKALQPVEFEADVMMGHIAITMYFRGKDRNQIMRTLSDFMQNFTSSCDLELDGYKGKYRAFMTTNSYEKKNVKSRYILKIEFDGFFYDEEEKIVFDAVRSGEFEAKGTRRMPCVLEIYAKSALKNYTISGVTEDAIVIENLESGKTIVIDGIKGLVTVNGANAFEKADIWEFPSFVAGKRKIIFSDTKARVTIRYKPMWI